MLNYYYSGAGITLGSPDKLEIERLVKNCNFRLLSCHGSYVSFAERWLEIAKELKYPITVLFDSGAFTAWNKGDEVKLEDLLKVYYSMMEKYFTSNVNIFLINLDKIPGSPGRTADKKEIDECIKISDGNYNILVKYFGERVLPVFHQNESEKRLQEIVKMAPYICISPRNDVPEKSRVLWSKEVHSKIPRSTKTHGLATTGIQMMTEVPWFSVDSATWIFITSTGSVILCINGKLKILGISERSSAKHNQDYHYNNVLPEVRRIIDKAIEENGLTFEKLNTSLNSRMLMSIMEINKWLKNHHQFINMNHTGLFDL